MDREGRSCDGTEMAARRALVTGATGFIGSHLVPALLADGYQVRACGRRTRPATIPDEVDYRRVDLVDGITHVFHLAGASSSRSSQEEMRRDNVEASEHLLDAVVAAGSVARVLIMSTTAVYGEEEELPSPVPEDVRPHPSRGYGKAKWEAEQAAWRAGDAGLPVVVVRPVSVHGPGAVKLVASAALDVALEHAMGLDRLVVHRQPVEQRLVHVDDLVGACLHLVAHPEAAGRAFNVASGVYPTSHEVAGILARCYGMEVVLDDDPDAGPSYDERAATRASLVAAGMDDSILLSQERLRFLRKTNRNNRISLEALASTGFRLGHADPGPAISADVEWYRRHRWLPDG